MIKLLKFVLFHGKNQRATKQGEFDTYLAMEVLPCHLWTDKDPHQDQRNATSNPRVGEGLFRVAAHCPRHPGEVPVGKSGGKRPSIGKPEYQTKNVD